MDEENKEAKKQDIELEDKKINESVENKNEEVLEEKTEENV